MRDLTKTIAVASLLVPASAQPLGIGDLKLHSALNQQLNAEINLVLSGGEKASEIKVQLAPPEKFDEAGVPWSYFLSKIKFDTVVRPNGTVIVKLSSNEALREPFLNFLLEVSWDQGNLYREFTVLIDPPTAYQQPIIPIIEQAPAGQQPSATPSITPTPQPKITAPVLQAEITADSYGPTTRKDTLWKIAEKVKPSADISTEQMMVAIYEANSRAFYKDNVNALMAGKTLRVPDQQTVLKLSKAQAASIFRKQNEVWNSPSKAVAKAKVEQQAEIEQAIADGSQLDLVAPTEEEVTDQVAVTPGQELSGDDSADAVTGNVIGSADKASDAALQSRLDKLEQQIAMMQKLLELKDEQLAALQNKQKSSEAVIPEQVVSDKTPVIVEQSAQQAEPAKPEEPKKSVAVKATPKPKPKPAPAPVEPESSLFGDAYYTIVGGLGIALLAGLGWLWWRKRKVEEQTETDSMFAASSEIRMPDSEEAGSSGVASFDESANYDVGTVGESSFLSEFTPSDFDAFDTDQSEVDPISEADVYLAYGRYQQAEDLMRHAIEEDPERNECKLKLLEIFYANENKEAFELYANELKEAGKQNDFAFWAKVVEMGNEIIPDSALLTAGKGNKTDFPVDDKKAAFIAEKDDAESKPMFADSDEPEQDVASATDDLSEDEFSLDLSDAESNNDALDFDLSSFADSEPETSSDEKKEEIESVEFDVNSVNEEATETVTETVSDELETFDFDFKTPADEDTSIEDEQDKTIQMDSAEDDENIESFDFSGLEAEQANKPDDKTEIGLNDADTEDDFDFNFDFDEVPSSSEGEKDDAGVADLTDMDEFETKIDLARAYIDMGDADAAKSIVEEVLEKGSDEQKKTAQSILDQLT